MLFGQGRKRQFEYKKLESIHMKQQAVLKRKTEEVSSTITHNHCECDNHMMKREPVFASTGFNRSDLARIMDSFVKFTCACLKNSRLSHCIY